MHWTGERLGPVTGWSKWNYEGFEAKKTWPIFERINKELAGDIDDPRVVYEHSQDHNMFGSSRAFESLPLFAGRATLEGLYMQASITAPFVFYIQSMISSQSSQPFPQYSYAHMDLNRAPDYLKLFNVRKLIIKSNAAKQAIQRENAYTKVKTIGQYEIWELMSNQDRYVLPLQFEPVVFQGTVPWKQVAHQWFSRAELSDVHLVFNAPLKEKNGGPLRLAVASLHDLPRQPIDISDCNIEESINNQEILLETSCIGKPHLIKVSYHPNWQVEGADKVYLVSPSFMLVFPQDNKVRLFYGPGPWDRLGQLLSLFGLFVLLLHVPLPTKKGGTCWDLISKHFDFPVFHEIRLPIDPSTFARKTIMLVILAGSSLAIAAAAFQAYINEPYRGYNRSIQYKDAGQYEKARTGFRNFMQQYPIANLAQESSYYIAITYYLEKNDPEALNAFEDYIKLYQHGNRAAEVYYHMGLIHLRTGQKEEAIPILQALIENYPGTNWANYARERLQEQMQ
jgi:tetratricopeptide (TPR) repeat protein